MKIINFHIFDSDGVCDFSLNPIDPRQNSLALLHGFTCSLKDFSSALASPLHLNKEDDDFLCFTTPRYRMVVMEFQKGKLKFILIVSKTSSETGETAHKYRSMLEHIYLFIYVPGLGKTVALFRKGLTRYLRKFEPKWSLFW